MKKYILPLILLLLFSLSGCSNYYQIGAVESNSSAKFAASYHKLHGTKDAHLTVEEGKSITVNVNIKTKSGKIDAFIYNDQLDYAYEGHDIPTSSFTVTLTEPGDYTIKVDADMHKGSYSFTWD